MSVVFEQVADEVEEQAYGEKVDHMDELLHPLDHRARRVLELFANQKYIRCG